MDQGENEVPTRDELTVAKINAAIKILEWSKDDIEPGIGGTPTQMHVALADAFRTVFNIVSETVGPSIDGVPAMEPIPEAPVA
jgi:hypothetical protein